MSNLKYQGIPTTPDQREFFTDLGLVLIHESGGNGSRAEIWAPTWAEKGDMNQILIRTGGRPDKGEIFPYGDVRPAFKQIRREVFPEEAVAAVAESVKSAVYAEESVLGFNLYNCGAGEIVEALRILARGSKV